jgi:8-oxo-dGTP pyrophosphatase MutT (NUDIX family)
VSGPRVRTDVVDVYAFRRHAGSGVDPAARVEFLQLLRAEAPLAGTWQPIMAHLEEGESALACALRELQEEAGLGRRDPALLGFFALEQVHPYFLPERDAVMLSARFAAEVSPVWAPRLNREHSAWRWTGVAALETAFLWPGQRSACREVLSEIVRETSPSRERMRIDARSM